MASPSANTPSPQGLLTVIIGLLALLVVASFVTCFFSAKVWHWAQVLLVEVLFLTGLGFFILAGEVLRIQNIYGNEYNKNAATIEREAPRVEALLSGTRDSAIAAALEADDIRIANESGAGEDETPRMLGVRELDHKLGLVTRTRGRAWRDVDGIGLDDATLTVSLKIEFPDPHSIETDAILYAFEQGPAAGDGQEGALYIGEFRVTGVAAQQIQLQPAGQFDARSTDRLTKTRFPWILYENMPVDQHPDGLLEIFAGATDEELKQVLPAESVEEYIRHGTPKEADDDEWHIDGYDENGKLVGPDQWGPGTQYKYRRMLRDYNLIFQEQSKRFIEMQVDKNALVEDNRQLTTALASAKELQSRREEEQQKLEHDLAGFSRDRQAIEAHLAQVETQLANALKLLETTKLENAGLAAMLESAVR
ncbi:MAG: hypothetical protein ACR2NU_15465 [Aeoliella sp.]